MLWVTIHLLVCNVSNQAKSEEEDSANRPWRPLPSKRISQSQAIVLRWIAVLAALGYSAVHGAQFIALSSCLTLTTILYDDMGLSGHVIGKNACNILGYVVFETGAVMLIGYYPISKYHIES